MKPHPFAYHRPVDLDDALNKLAELPNPKIIAGGQSLVPMLNFRVAQVDNLIDLGEIVELKKIEKFSDYIEIGPMVSQRELLDSPVLKKYLPVFQYALSYVGHVQTRNRGTIGGSLCHLDPSAELPLLAIGFDAELFVKSKEDSRIIPAYEFAEYMLSPSIEEDEILTNIRIPIKPWNGWGFTEYSRRHGDFAIVAALCMIKWNEKNIIEEIVIAAGGLCDVPFRLKELEKKFIGRCVNKLQFNEIVPKKFEFEALDDPFVPAWYRNRIACEAIKTVISQSICGLHDVSKRNG